MFLNAKLWIFKKQVRYFNEYLSTIHASAFFQNRFTRYSLSSFTPCWPRICSRSSSIRIWRVKMLFLNRRVRFPLKSGYKRANWPYMVHGQILKIIFNARLFALKSGKLGIKAHFNFDSAWSFLYRINYSIETDAPSFAN